jgi:hypothetical protein
LLVLLLLLLLLLLEEEEEENKINSRHRWCLHLIVVVGFEWSRDPESYAGGSVATGRTPMLDRSRGRSQTKRDTLVLQVGG